MNNNNLEGLSPSELLYSFHNIGIGTFKTNQTIAKQT